MKNNNKRKGFTLVELLGTIVVLSIVLGIVGLTITNTIKKAKAESYQVTINEIESHANDYLIENSNRLFFLTKKIKNEETNEEYLIEYQCVTVRNLIDYGYLDDNITKSEVANKKYASTSDYIYVERDFKTKAINETSYNGGDVGVCDRAVKAQGDIYFIITPAGINTFKNVAINYRINNLNDVNTAGEYTYIYSYDKSYEAGPEPNTVSTRTMKATENDGTITARIMNGDTEIASASEIIDDIDLIGPVIKEGNYTGNKTVRGKLIYPLVVTDEGIGANYGSFTADDITVKIGGITIPQNGTTENYSLEHKGNGQYNLTIKNLNYAGKAEISVAKDTVQDRLGNNNAYKEIETGITFSNEYTITFEKNGGNAPSKTTQKVTYNKPYGELATITRTGYDFDGWYTSASGGNKIAASSTVLITDDQTLYAHWTAKTYTVTFDKNGGSTPSPTTKSVTYDGTYGSLATTSRTGYDFAGWYTSASGGSKIESTTKVNITANQTLYAHWTAKTYTITYDSAGGSSCTAFTVNYNGTISSLCTPTRSGYIFLGWYYGGGSFDANYYADNNADVVNVYGRSRVLDHWKEYGLKEGRISSTKNINAGTAHSYKYTIDGNTTLTAQWEKKPESSGGGGGGNCEWVCWHQSCSYSVDPGSGSGGCYGAGCIKETCTCTEWHCQ